MRDQGRIFILLRKFLKAVVLGTTASLFIALGVFVFATFV